MVHQGSHCALLVAQVRGALLGRIRDCRIYVGVHGCGTFRALVDQSRDLGEEFGAWKENKEGMGFDFRRDFESICAFLFTFHAYDTIKF